MQTELGNATADSLIRLFLPMHQPVAYGADGASDVDDRNRPFQLVMAGLVKKIAETDNPHSFPDKIHRQPRRGAAEHANHRIQFLSATLQVGMSHREVGAI